MLLQSVQHKMILQKAMPEDLKLSIAKKIENNLFSKVLLFYTVFTSECRAAFSPDVSRYADLISGWTASSW
jgi:hypothetical protein